MMRRTLGVRIDSVEPLPNGQVLIDGTAGVVGVLHYAAGEVDDQPRAELVDRDALFEPASIATLIGAPVTVHHPRGGMGPRGEGKAIGSVSHAAPRGDELGVRIRVWDADGVAAINAGTRELSLGYTAEFIAEPGEHAGERHDGRQASRRYDHLAIVDRARAGSAARLRLDHAMPDKYADALAAIKKAKTRADEISAGTLAFSMDGQTIEVELSPQMVAEVFSAVLAMQAAGAGATEPPPEEAEPNDAMQPDPMAEDARKDAAAKYTDADVARIARERAKLERTVAPLLPAGYDYAKASDLALRGDAIVAHSPSERAAVDALVKRGDTYAQGRLDALLDAALAARTPITTQATAPAKRSLTVDQLIALHL